MVWYANDGSQSFTENIIDNSIDGPANFDVKGPPVPKAGGGRTSSSRLFSFVVNVCSTSALASAMIFWASARASKVSSRSRSSTSASRVS